MLEKLKPLYELQKIDLDIANAEKTKAALDDGTVKRQQVDIVRQRFQLADKAYHDATSEMQDSELNLKSVETKQKNFRDKMYSGKVSNPKELESMEKEIEMLGRQKDKLEERILELMDIIEERKVSLDKARAVQDKYEAELAAVTEKSKQASAVLDEKIRLLRIEREKALPSVDPILLKRYETTRVRMGGVVVSLIVESNCSACHTQITDGLIRALKKSENVETCENCSRILYVE